MRRRKVSYRQHREQAKHSPVGVLLDIPEELAVDADPAEREARFRAGWDAGFLFGISGTYGDLLLDPAANELAAEFIRQQIREIVDDPDVAEALSPRNHPFGTKRPCLDTGYYATFNRPNVSPRRPPPRPDRRDHAGRDPHRRGRHRPRRARVRHRVRRHDRADPRHRHRRADGQPLREKWSAGPRTYLGLATAGFPNLFMITGPGSPSVLSNMMVSIEQHVDWVADCLAALRQRGAATIEATVAAEDGWVAHVNEVADTTLMPRANSWYLGANVPGKPRVFMPYVGGVGIYREICDTVAAKDYDGFELR